MTIIWDLDYTLLDSARLKDELFKALAALGPTRQQVEQAYDETVKRSGVVYDYDTELHIEKLRPFLSCDIDEARQAISGVAARTREFLFPGATEILVRLRAAGAKQILLTLGNRGWQQLKIDASGLAEFFDQVITTDAKKGEIIAQISTDPDTIVVNDNGGEVSAMREAMPSFTYIVKRGPKGVPQDFEATVCDTFDEIEARLTPKPFKPR